MKVNKQIYSMEYQGKKIYTSTNAKNVFAVLARKYKITFGISVDYYGGKYIIRKHLPPAKNIYVLEDGKKIDIREKYIDEYFGECKYIIDNDKIYYTNETVWVLVGSIKKEKENQ